MTSPSNEGRFTFFDYSLQSGDVLSSASIVYKTYGTLSPAKDNVILYPTSYSATHAELEWLIGPKGILDSSRWFVIIPNMFGSGLSSSPSNTADYPSLVTSADNVHAQHRLLQDAFGIEKLAGVYGFSMGAQQAYHWAALYPDAVERIVVVCGSARTAVHNQVFLLSVASILEAAPEHVGNGRFSAPPTAALRAFGRSYAAWAMSQDFYRAGLHLSALKASSLDDFLRTQWEGRFVQRDAANLYAQLQTWITSDISANPLYDGDLVKALKAIRARVLLMPSASDLYFRVADNEAELPHLKSAELAPIPSVWGHRAGNPAQNAEDALFIRDHVRRLFGGDRV
jgi:homoserine O-acetyltransferase/O-succinyltransferase